MLRLMLPHSQYLSFVLLLFKIQLVVGLRGVASSIVKVTNTAAMCEQKGSITFRYRTVLNPRSINLIVDFKAIIIQSANVPNLLQILPCYLFAC